MNNPVVEEKCLSFDQWKYCAPGLGNRKKNLAIKGGCFAHESHSESVLTYFKCQIWRSDNDNFGKTLLIKLTVIVISSLTLHELGHQCGN